MLPAIFEIYDFLGHKLFSQILAPENKSISVSQLNLIEGIYMFRVTQNGNIIATNKIVIIK